jgi:hypothetical protein
MELEYKPEILSSSRKIKGYTELKGELNESIDIDPDIDTDREGI